MLVLLLLLPSIVRAEGQDIKIITKEASDELTDDTERDIDRMIVSYVNNYNVLKGNDSVRVIVGQPIYLFGDIIQYDFPVIIDNKVVSIFEHRPDPDGSSGSHGTTNYDGYKLMNISDMMSPYVTKIVDRSDLAEYDRSGNPPGHGNTNYDDRDSWITIQETNLKFLNYVIIFDLIVIAIFSVLIFFELRKKREYQDKNSNQYD